MDDPTLLEDSEPRKGVTRNCFYLETETSCSLTIYTCTCSSLKLSVKFIIKQWPFQCTPPSSPLEYHHTVRAKGQFGTALRCKVSISHLALTVWTENTRLYVSTCATVQLSCNLLQNSARTCISWTQGAMNTQPKTAPPAQAMGEGVSPWQVPRGQRPSRYAS